MSSVHEAEAPLVPGETIGGDQLATPTRLLPAHGRGPRRWLYAVLPPLLVAGLIIGVWYFISYVMIKEERVRYQLQPPHRVVADGFFNGDAMAKVADALVVTGRTALIGLAISIVLGTAVAVLMSQARWAERAIFPYAVMLQAIPILALTPLISVWFGTGAMARTIVCVLISLFPIIVNTLFGLQSAERGMHDLFTLQHVSRRTRLMKLMFPAALPAFFAGLRISAGLSVIGAVVGDFYFGRGTPGLGQLLKRYANQLDGEELLATVIITCLVGVLVFVFFGWLNRRITSRWQDDVAIG